MMRGKKMNDEYAKIEEIKKELKPIINFLKFTYGTEENLKDVSLLDDVSFNLFNNYFPEISEEKLIKVLDYFRDNLEETAFAKEELVLEALK